LRVMDEARVTHRIASGHVELLGDLPVMVTESN